MCIKGGYILQPRSIDESEVKNYPPHVREIWFYLLRKANFIDSKINGKIIKRGQLLTSYSDILEGLSWKVGYRKEVYKIHHAETTMKTLTKAKMITKARTTRGMIITICKYDYYQTPKNYDNQSENHNDNHNESHNDNHPISKKEKNVNNVNNKKIKLVKEKNSLTCIKDFKKDFISDTNYFKTKGYQLKVSENYLLSQARTFIKFQTTKNKEWKSLKDLRLNFILWFKKLQENREHGIINH